MIDREGPVPIYVQVAQIIHDRIDEGRLRVGAAVPSEAALEAEFGIARTTARRVARELRERGLIHTVRGEGTYVGALGVPRQRTTKPLYEEIAENIAARIVSGELRPNRRIPPEQTLIREHGVAKVTARSAVARLREQGWVFTVPYRGTYVAARELWPSQAP
ncbi:GntR family transcriptional regulator [Nonomuraea sp. NPDC005983]|uniref:GntR family transcriptional regulator n=1 Tax=Nonomuraea sp. NPDC005983 TaxID=3155595 RepID=UPI0033A5A81C